jgi:hypothetical protein
MFIRRIQDYMTDFRYNSLENTILVIVGPDILAAARSILLLKYHRI